MRIVLLGEHNGVNFVLVCFLAGLCDDFPSLYAFRKDVEMPLVVLFTETCLPEMNEAVVVDMHCAHDIGTTAFLIAVVKQIHLGCVLASLGLQCSA